MKLLNFTIIKLTLFLVIGISIAHGFDLPVKTILLTTISLTVILGFIWKTQHLKIETSVFFGTITFLIFIGIGMLSYSITDDTLKTNHYTHQLSMDTNRFHSLVFKIEEQLKPDRYNQKYLVSLRLFNSKKASGQLLIAIKQDSLLKPLKVDAIYSTLASIKEIQGPLNPHQFDYNAYMAGKHIYHQLHLAKTDLLLLSNSTTTIYGLADNLRRTINSQLKAFGFKQNALSIMNALLLGQRQSIDQSIYNNYVNSGTIHILAVSGLHVGILLLILNALFRPLLFLKYGKFVRPTVIIILLWSFAIVAGLSPSVTRAVTMFSVISIAMHLKRPANIYNTLAISAFIILLFKPHFLFEVGFQLSYLAVLSIVSIQPILSKLWYPKFWVLHKLWQVFTVTFAAQIGVAPISLFYFHQFPGLFFISNLVVIPFLGLILSLGLLIIILALINYLPQVLVDGYTLIIDNLNAFIAWIAHFEEFLLRDIPFTIAQLICSYIVIIALVQLYTYKSFRWVAASLVGILCFQFIVFHKKYSTSTEAFVIFNKSRHSIIGQKQNDKLVVSHNLDSIPITSESVISNYKVGESISTITEERLQNIYQFQNNHFLVVDSLGVYQNLSFNPQYILLRNSPKINLNRLIDSLQPSYIIADASNFKTYIKRWEQTCTYKKIPFHYTNEKGAFIIVKD